VNERFDRSGLWINAKDGGFAITDVARDSTGAQAALAIGDVIIAIDGKPAVANELADARRMLRDRSPGTQMTLTVRHASKTIALTLQDQI
jgi:C-terminal processing protease CtpA/Prc